MNPEEFIRMMNGLPDEMIDSANLSRFRHHHQFLYIIPAIAACFVALIAAAVYPKLRTQIPPITEPPMQTSETITSATVEPKSTTIQTATLPEQTVLTSDTVTVPSTVTPITETTAPEPDLPPEEITQTVQPDTELPTETTMMTESAQSIPETTALTGSQSVTLPIWKGRTDHPESELDSQIDCSFVPCPEDADDELRDLYGIPQNFDLSQNPCLLIMIRTTYADAAVIGGEITEEGLVLKIACLEKENAENRVIRCAIPLLENVQIEPENCYAEYIALTDETEYQAMLTDNLMIIINE